MFVFYAVSVRLRSNKESSKEECDSGNASKQVSSRYRERNVSVPWPSIDTKERSPPKSNQQGKVNVNC